MARRKKEEKDKQWSTEHLRLNDKNKEMKQILILIIQIALTWRSKKVLRGKGKKVSQYKDNIENGPNDKQWSTTHYTENYDRASRQNTEQKTKDWKNNTNLTHKTLSRKLKIEKTTRISLILEDEL